MSSLAMQIMMGLATVQMQKLWKPFHIGKAVRTTADIFGFGTTIWPHWILGCRLSNIRSSALLTYGDTLPSTLEATEDFEV